MQKGPHFFVTRRDALKGIGAVVGTSVFEPISFANDFVSRSVQTSSDGKPVSLYSGNLYRPARVGVLNRGEARPSVSLDGTWKFQLGEETSAPPTKRQPDGIDFSEQIQVPAALQTQGFGNKNAIEIVPWSYAVKTAASWRGDAWYKREFQVPANFDGKRVWLKFGGVHPTCDIWVNNQYIGFHSGSLTPFKIDITSLLRGSNEVVLRIVEDRKLRLLGGKYNFEVLWSGINRAVEVEATNDVCIGETFHLQPDINASKLRVSGTVERFANSDRRNLQLIVDVRPSDGKGSTYSSRLKLDASATKETGFAVEVAMPGARLWDDENPFLYNATLRLIEGDKLIDEVVERFGMRQISWGDGKIYLNGRPIYLRGYGDDAIHPTTLIPTPDRQTHKEQLVNLRKFGFNFARHHTGVPVPEYLDAADEVGMLVQSEVAMVGNQTQGPYPQTQQMFREVLLRDRNHPCIIAYSMGNEGIGPGEVEWVNASYEIAKQIDSEKLFLCVTGVDYKLYPEAKTEMYQARRDHRGADEKVPLVLHEYGYWASFPNVELLKKYEQRNCQTRPYWIHQAVEAARGQNQEDLLPLYAKNSELLQATMRKAGLERTRRDTGVVGYVLWTGMNVTWEVAGALDEFAEPKVVPASEFAGYNEATVLLMSGDLENRTFWANDNLKLTLMVSHFGREPMRNGKLSWRLKEGERIVGQGENQDIAIERSQVRPITDIDVALPNVTEGKKITLEASLQWSSRRASNSWDFWVFPKDLLTASDKDIGLYRPGLAGGGSDITRYAPVLQKMKARYPFMQPVTVQLTNYEQRLPHLVVTASKNQGLADFLIRGGRAIQFSHGLYQELGSLSKFWETSEGPGFNTVKNGETFTGTSGTVIANHKALAGFPHDGYCDLQFKGLLGKGTDNNYNDILDLRLWTKGVTPIIRAIGNYKTCFPGAYLMEVKVGRGALLVCQMTLDQDTPASQYLFDRLLRYALGSDFNPQVEINPALLY